MKRGRTQHESGRRTGTRQTRTASRTNNRSKPKRWLRTNLWRGLTLTAFAIMLIWSVYPLRYQLTQRKEIKELRAKLGTLTSENGAIKEEIDRLHSDAYVEQIAREKFGLIKPGEEAYVVIPEKTDAAQADEARADKAQADNRQTQAGVEKEKESTEGLSWWGKLSRYLSSLVEQTP